MTVKQGPAIPRLAVRLSDKTKPIREHAKNVTDIEFKSATD